MHPIFLTLDLPLLGKLEFPAYMTLLVAGFMTAIWMCRRDEDRRGGRGELIVDLGLLMLVFGVLGARLLSVIADGHLTDFVHLCTSPELVPALDAKVAVCTTDAQCGYDYLCYAATSRCVPPRDCLAAFKFWQGGLAYYGGFLAAAPVGLWYARKRNLGVLRIADMTSPWIALGLFFGRMGCFFNGCCFGVTAPEPWAVTFPGAPHVHPTQLYEALSGWVLWAILYFGLRPRQRAHGQVFAALLVGYGVVRFVLEYWRADERGGFAGLSTSQWIGIPLVLAGVWLWTRVTKTCAPAATA